MNSTTPRRGLACVLAGVLGFASLLFAAPSQALTGETGVDRFGGCLAAQKSGQLLLLVDESSSLKSSDPDANRVKAAQYLAQQLVDYSSRTGVEIDVSIAGFSSGYRQSLGWTTLDAASLAQIDSNLDGFRERNEGNETDYWSALDGARAELAQAPRPAEGRSCQGLAWFTDGKLDFSTSDTTKPFAPNVKLDTQDGVNAAIAAAQENICRDRGLADQIRSSDIVTFAIGLSPTPEQVPDFDLMKAIATGQSSGSVAKCGAVTSPVPGDFYLAQNIEDLLFAFDKVGTPDQPPIEIDTGACARVICEEAKHRFVLDRSVRHVSVLAGTDRLGLVPFLVAPDGGTLDLSGPAKDGNLGGVKVSSRPQSDKSVSFSMTGPQVPLWQGVWALVFVDPAGDGSAKTRSSIHIAGDLLPAWPDAKTTTLRNKEMATLKFAVVGGDGKPVDATTLLGQASFSAVLVDTAGAEHPVANALAKDQISTPQTIDLSNVPPGAATLRLNLEVTTADATDVTGAAVPGTTLSPQRVDLPVTIAPPAGYPSVGEVIDFGHREGAGTLNGELNVTGPGCVWLPDDAKNTVRGAPDGVGDIELNAAANTRDNCVKLVEGEQKFLSVTMTVPNAGNGSANGTVEVMLGPDTGDGAPVAVQVDYTASLQKQLNTLNFWLALIVALVLGPGIPLVLFYLSKWVVARIPARGLRAEQIPVRIAGESVLRDHGPFAVADGELNNLVRGLDKPARRLDLGGGVELHAKMGASPLGTGYVVAKAAGMAGAAGRSGAITGKTPDAKLPLAVHNTWFVLHDPSGPAEFATVVLLASVEADARVIERMTIEIVASLPKVLSDLRARAAPHLAATPPNNQPPNPFGVGPGGPGLNPFGGPARPGGSPFGAPLPSGNPFGGSGQPGGSPFGSPQPGPGPSPYGSPAPGGNPFGPPGPSQPGGNPFGGPGQSGSAPSGPGSNPFG
mgnify:CR=1 FL=1